jgi:hypothetical protein
MTFLVEDKNVMYCAFTVTLLFFALLGSVNDISILAMKLALEHVTPKIGQRNDVE